MSHRHGRIPNARRKDIELVFDTFGCNFSLAFQRAKERRNPSSYAKVMVVGANATQNGVFGVRLESFCAGVTLSRTTSTIEGDITFMHTRNNPHSGCEPMPLQGPITRAHARQLKLSSWTQTSVLRRVDTDSPNFCVRTRIGTFFGSLES